MRRTKRNDPTTTRPRPAIAAQSGDPQDGKDTRFVVRRSTTGLGLFAVRPIEDDRRLLEYVGPRLTLAQARRLGGRYLMELADDRFIDGRGRDNPARYINHSCRPNCAAYVEGDRVWIWSTSPIAPGEELAYDYGKEYTSTLFGPGGCRCPACRTVRRLP